MAVDRSVLPVPGPDAPFAPPTVVRHRLANGLEVRTVEHRSVPLVSLVLQVPRGGSGADPSGREGLASLAADMVDEGTGDRSALDVADALARIGASYSGRAGHDSAVFALSTLARFADRGAALLADLVLRPSLRTADLDRVRAQRLDRLRQMRDIPQAAAEREFLRLLYGAHPYGHQAIGNAASLAAITGDDLAGFHASAYRPSGACLVVAGAFSHDELLAVAERAFGGWDAPSPDAAALDAGPLDAGPPAIDQPPQPAGERLVVVPRPGAAQSEVWVGLLTARRSTPDYPALLVMNAILGGEFVSRLNTKLREEKAVTYVARTGFDWRAGLSPFLFQTRVETRATAEAAADAREEMAAIGSTRPPTGDELSMAIAALTRGFPRNFETVEQVARSVGRLALYGLPEDYFDRFVPAVRAVTSDDVVRVASQYLDADRLVTLVVGDHDQVGESLAALGLGEPVIRTT
jgi:predicted Zn-dependent peptidase